MSHNLYPWGRLRRAERGQNSTNRLLGVPTIKVETHLGGEAGSTSNAPAAVREVFDVSDFDTPPGSPNPTESNDVYYLFDEGSGVADGSHQSDQLNNATEQGGDVNPAVNVITVGLNNVHLAPAHQPQPALQAEDPQPAQAVVAPPNPAAHHLDPLDNVITNPRDRTIYDVRVAALTGRTPYWEHAATLLHRDNHNGTVRAIRKRQKKHHRKAAFAVFQGVADGVYDDWTITKPQVDGFPEGAYRGFWRAQNAQRAYDFARREGWTRSEDVTLAQLATGAGIPIPFQEVYDHRLAPPRTQVESEYFHALQATEVGEDRRYHVVTRGVRPGIYLTWIECHMLVTGIPDSIYDSFEELHSARVYWRFALDGNYTEVIDRPEPDSEEEEEEDVEAVIELP